MTKWLLDAFCGAGGATRGYQDVGWKVVGVDHVGFIQYCGDDFVCADAVRYIREHGHKFDAIHASPPCQASSALTKGTNAGRKYPQLIPPTRAALEGVGKPWVIENVAGAPIRNDLMLCGEMFDLRVIRHRYFEFGCGEPAPRIEHPQHRSRVAGWRHGERYDGYYFAVHGDGGGKGSVTDWQYAMGIGWMTNKYCLAQAIPPAYTEYVGRYLACGPS